MSWNAACIFINENAPGYFGCLPPHSGDRALPLLAQLYPATPVAAVTRSNLLAELVPQKGYFAFGAYGLGCLLIDLEEIVGCTTDKSRPLLQRCLSSFPRASVLVFELGGGVNAFGYALYDNARLVRAYAGTARDGITIDEGELLPEERPFFRESEVREGQRFFRRYIHGELREYSATSMGESLAFAVSARMLGTTFDRFAAESLEVERFRRV